MKKRNYKKNSKYNRREDTDMAAAKKQRLEERLAEITADSPSEESRAALPASARKRIEAALEFYGKKENND